MAYVNRSTFEIVADTDGRNDPIWSCVPDEFAELQLKLFMHAMAINAEESKFGSPFSIVRDYQVFNDKTREESCKSAADYIASQMTSNIVHPLVDRYTIKNNIDGTQDKSVIVHSQFNKNTSMVIVVDDPHNVLANITREDTKKFGWIFERKRESEDSVAVKYYFKLDGLNRPGNEFSSTTSFTYLKWKLERVERLYCMFVEYFEHIFYERMKERKAKENSKNSVSED